MYWLIIAIHTYLKFIFSKLGMSISEHARILFATLFIYIYLKNKVYILYWNVVLFLFFSIFLHFENNEIIKIIIKNNFNKLRKNKINYNIFAISNLIKFLRFIIKYIVIDLLNFYNVISLIGKNFR